VAAWKSHQQFGVQFIRYQQNNLDPGNEGTLGIFNYSGQFTSNPALKATGYSYADFVLDRSVSAGIGGVRGYTGQRQWRDAAFAQDDWKLLSNLTLNLGIRYEYDQPIYEVNDKQVNVNLTNPSLGTAGLEYAGQNGNSRALYNPVNTNFMPRIGFAYQPKQRIVIRGGYGTTVTLEGTGSSLRLTEKSSLRALVYRSGDYANLDLRRNASGSREWICNSAWKYLNKYDSVICLGGQPATVVYSEIQPHLGISDQ
jgi:hypothetical protein